MKRSGYKSFLLILTTLMFMTLAGCQKKENKEYETTEEIKEVILNLGLDPLDREYSLLNYHEESILSYIFSNVCSLDSNGKLVDEAGHVTVEEITNKDGEHQFLYTISIQEDMYFTDGEPVTIDDVLAYYYICADPSYEGISNFKELDIVGLKEYYYDVQDADNILAEIEKYDNENISKEDFVTYIVNTKAENWFDGIHMSEGGPMGDGSITWAQYCAMCGVATLQEAAAICEDLEMLNLLAEAEWKNSAGLYDFYSYYKNKAAMDALADGINVDTISGVQKIDDYTCTILFNSFDISSEKEVANIPIIPKHYYCTGFRKGNLSCIEEKKELPLGSGEYIFSECKEDEIYLKANNNYFKGCPEVSDLNIHFIKENNKIEAVLNGKVNTINLKFSTATLELLEQYSDRISYTVLEEDGYGYIGIHSEKIDDLDVRKGLMHLMDRRSAVNSYFGDHGTIVERPMIPTLAEYPQNTNSYYEYDVTRALEYFEAAGYSKTDGKLLSPEGQQLKIVAGIAEPENHPIADIFEQMSKDLSLMGAEFIIKELSFEDLNAEIQNDELDLWAMAWGNETSCDSTEMFGSNGELNYYKYSNEEIDSIQKEIIRTKDFDRRCELVSKELDMIMESAICMPVYQKKYILIESR